MLISLSKWHNVSAIHFSFIDQSVHIIVTLSILQSDSILFSQLTYNQKNQRKQENRTRIEEGQEIKKSIQPTD